MASTRVTWQDTLLMPEDGNRYEAIGGELYVTPAPRPRHQRICSLLGIELHHLLDAPGHGVVFSSPVGVELKDTDEGVQPDLTFIAAERLDIIGETVILGAPDLVIEVLSPGTAKRDRTTKREFYERFGVSTYWIVDDSAKLVEVWDFHAGASDVQPYSDRLPVTIRGRHFGDIDMASIFTPEP